MAEPRDAVAEEALPGGADEDAVEGAPDWVVTFADLMSLLLCFFVLLLSFSRLDNERFKELAGSLREAFGVQRLVPAFDVPRGLDLVARDFSASFTADFIDRLRATVARESATAGEPVGVRGDERGIVITIDDDLLFGSGSAVLTGAGAALLHDLVPMLREFQGEIQIEGHTDDRPYRRGSDSRDHNWELSYARALAVLRLFVDAGGIAAERLVPSGRGPSKPVASNLTARGRARNRRVELRLVGDVRDPDPLARLPMDPDPMPEESSVFTALPELDETLIPEARFTPMEVPRSAPASLFPARP